MIKNQAFITKEYADNNYSQPDSYIKNIEVQTDKLIITKKDDTSINFDVSNKASTTYVDNAVSLKQDLVIYSDTEPENPVDNMVWVSDVQAPVAGQVESAIRDGDGNVIKDTYTTNEYATANYATKSYVDDTFLPLTGGTISGSLTITGNITPNVDGSGYLGTRDKRFAELNVEYMNTKDTMGGQHGHSTNDIVFNTLSTSYYLGGGTAQRQMCKVSKSTVSNALYYDVWFKKVDGNWSIHPEKDCLCIIQFRNDSQHTLFLRPCTFHYGTTPPLYPGDKWGYYKADGTWDYTLGETRVGDVKSACMDLSYFTGTSTANPWFSRYFVVPVKAHQRLAIYSINASKNFYDFGANIWRIKTFIVE